MSMTKEEAIERIKEIKDSAWGYHIGGEILGIPYDEFCEIMDTVVSALRPITREQVEKVWRGEWHSYYKSEIHAGNGVVCSKCDMWNNRAAHFCPSCGAPMTDEAVQMVLERMEALYETD